MENVLQVNVHVNSLSVNTLGYLDENLNWILRRDFTWDSFRGKKLKFFIIYFSFDFLKNPEWLEAAARRCFAK